MRSKLEDLKELRDLVRSLGRGGGWGPLRRAPIQFLDMKVGFCRGFFLLLMRRRITCRCTSCLTCHVTVLETACARDAVKAAGWLQQHHELSGLISQEQSSARALFWASLEELLNWRARPCLGIGSHCVVRAMLRAGAAGAAAHGAGA